VKIEKKITGYRVKATDVIPEIISPHNNMHEKLERPDQLIGATYKIKTPVQEHALYVTINDVTLDDGSRHPYEIFINSKNMGDFQWVLALTRVMSAVFRKGGEIVFLVDELKAIFDPKGGYFKKGGVFMPSLVAEIGLVVEQHLKHIGRLKVEKDPHMEAFIAEKREQAKNIDKSTVCPKCNTKAVVILDGCATCLECGDSKCQ